MLCEDCYMDALSPAKTCDPWAVHSAKSFGKNLGGKFELTELQRKILEILKETGGAPSEHLVERLNISPDGPRTRDRRPAAHGKGARRAQERQEIYPVVVATVICV